MGGFDEGFNVESFVAFLLARKWKLVMMVRISHAAELNA